MKNHGLSLLAIVGCVAIVSLWRGGDAVGEAPGQELTAAPPAVSTPSTRATPQATPHLELGPHLKLVEQDDGVVITLTNRSPGPVEIHLRGGMGGLTLEDFDVFLRQGEKQVHPANWCGTGLEYGWGTLAPGAELSRKVPRDWVAYGLDDKAPARIHGGILVKVDGVRSELMSEPITVSIAPLPSPYE